MREIDENLIEEWKSLRDEIARKQGFVERLILTAVTGSLAIFSFAAIEQIPWPVNALLALMPVVLVTLSYFWILRYFYSGARLAKYIKEYIEPKTGLNWETWVNSLRRDTQSQGQAGMRADTFSVFYHSLLSLSLIVCVALIWQPHWPYKVPAIPASTVSSQVALTTTQLPAVPASVCLALTIGVIIFWTTWYVAARASFIKQTKEDIRKLMRDLQAPSG